MAEENKSNTNSKFLQVHHQSCMDAMGHAGTYTGRIEVANGLPDGAGAMEYLENNTNIRSYQGEWQQGYWHTSPSDSDSNGDNSNGDNGNGNGNGSTCVLQNGDVYTGQFHQHERHGTGEYTWNVETTDKVTKQRQYSGQFQHNQRQGHGKYVWTTTPIHPLPPHGEDATTPSTIGTPITTTPTTTGTPTAGTPTTPTPTSSSTSSTYTGWFDNGVRQGHGVYTSLKLQYTGEWWHGSYHGYGVLEWFGPPQRGGGAGGTTYRGSFSHGVRQGRGVETRTKDGSLVHEGLWKQDKPVTQEEPLESPLESQSPSQVTSTTAATAAAATKKPLTSTLFSTPQPLQDAQGHSGFYKGIVEQGMPQGVGTMVYYEDDQPDDIIEYEGFWQDGHRHGFGRVSYRNEDSYQGNFVQNYRQGQGEYTTADGRLFKGLFHRNVPHGSDIHVVYPNQDLYQGEYVHGHRQGHGRLEFFSSGSFYEGEWKQGMYHGKGTLVTSATIYTGNFAQGVYHGEGCIQNGSDQNAVVLYQGEWIEGKPSSSSSSSSSMEGPAAGPFEIPHPPLDEQLGQPPPVDNNDKDNDKDASLPTLLRRTFSPLPALPRKLTPIPKGTIAPPRLEQEEQHEDPKPTPLIATSLAASLYASFTGATTAPSKPSSSSRPPKKKEDCKAVVDMSVWDGQDNPGRYTGLLHLETQRPHGVGRMVYGDGNRIHEGFWEYGHRQGHGRCLFVQIGDYHEGNYHQNLRQGSGKYYWKDGRRYIGEYHLDERQGQGKFVYPNGDFYKGAFEKGQRHGVGTFVFGQKKCQYQGQWQHGVYHGSGRLEWKNGDDTYVYKGRLEQGLFHGHGTESANSKVAREGMWEKGKFVQEATATGPSIDTIESKLTHQSVANLGLEEVTLNSNHDGNDKEDKDEDDSLKERRRRSSPRSRKTSNKKPDRNISSPECASSLEQNYEIQRLQWRSSLEQGNNN